MEDANLDFAKNLVRYFNCKFIGSILLYFYKNLLELGDINDIDLVCKEQNLENINNYLVDNGFKCNHNIKNIINYEQFKQNVIYSKNKEDLNINICFVNNNSKIEIYDIYTLIDKKLRRGNYNDFKQCLKAIFSLQEVKHNKQNKII